MPKQSKRARLGDRLPVRSMDVNITSLLDIMTILLVFMLQNYAVDPSAVMPGEDLQLVESANTQAPQKNQLAVTISAGHILVDKRPVVRLVNGRVPASQKRDGEDGYLITPLLDALNDAKGRAMKKPEDMLDKSLKKILIVGDRGVSYRLLSEVLYTAGQADYNECEFAVLNL